MHQEKIEAIVLRSQDYQERHRIITLYSPLGLLTMIVKNISRKNARLLALTSVFTQAEYLFSQTHSPFLRFIDGSLLDEHLLLRKQLSWIQAAAYLTKTLLTTQLPGKPAPELFALYKAYLKQIPTFPDPTSLLFSFSLKLLKHEGLLHLTSHCTHCSAPAIHIDQGESLCASHSSSHPFLPEEWQQLHTLYAAKQFSTLHALSILPSLPKKIESILSNLICV